MRKSFIVFISLIIFALFINPADASLKCAFGKKYEIPPLSQSHLQLGESSERALNPKSIKVLVWNILKGYKKTFDRDFSRMAMNQDLLLLQEGYWSDHVVSALEHLPNFQFDFAVSFIYKKDNHTPTGTMLGSKVTPLDFRNIRTEGLESFICTPKTTSTAFYEIDGSDKDLLVINIHGMNFTSTAKFQAQVLQAVELIKNHDGPVIYAGDFNTHLKKRKKWLKKTLYNEGLFDINFKKDSRKKFLVGELDHFFVRGLAVKNAWTEKNKSSDHAAMFAELSLSH